MKQTNLPPPTFTPDDPEGLYKAFMKSFNKIPISLRQYSDPSRHYADAWCAYLRERGHKAGDLKAMELRWMAHEWRRRSLEPPLEATNQWETVATGKRHTQPRHTQPRRELDSEECRRLYGELGSIDRVARQLKTSAGVVKRAMG